MTLTDFLLARIAEGEEMAACYHRLLCLRTACDNEGCIWDEDEQEAMERERVCTCDYPARVLAECEAKRRIVEWHKSWPVLVETPPKFELVSSGDMNSFAMRASQQVAWTTEQAYRDHFGTEPPTGPILRFLALPYADHPDYREEWRP